MATTPKCNNGWTICPCAPTSCSKYDGPTLPNSGITSGDNLSVVLQKLDYALTPTTIVQNMLNVFGSSLSSEFCGLVNQCPTTTIPPALKIKLVNSITADYLVGDATNVADWNTYFELPTYGNPFTSVTVISPQEVWLYGGSNIALQYDPFGDYDYLVSFIDEIGCIVTLDDACFEGNYSLETVSLPACTDASYGGAFGGCESLTSLYVPVLASAGGNTFSGCRSMVSFDLPSLTSVSAYMFSTCISMTSYNIPLINWSTITSLPVGLFSSCESMLSFDFPNLQSASDYLFDGCINAIINTPNITSAGTGSFMNCTAMTSFNFPLLTTVDFYTFYGCTGVTTFDFPSLIGGIPYYSFANCTSATTFNFPLMTYCSLNAFKLCTSATTFNLPSCVNLGGSVTDDQVFNGISGNTVTLTIPASRMTCNGGNPDGDIQYLQANNTVTIIPI